MRVAMTIAGELVSHSLLNGNKGLQPTRFIRRQEVSALAFFLETELKIIIIRKSEVSKC